MRPKLTDSIDVADLLQMRADGMSNRDIAEALDVTLRTVYRYIGPQGRYMKPKQPAQAKAPEPVKEPQKKRFLFACIRLLEI